MARSKYAIAEAADVSLSLNFSATIFIQSTNSPLLAWYCDTPRNLCWCTSLSIRLAWICTRGTVGGSRKSAKCLRIFFSSFAIEVGEREMERNGLFTRSHPLAYLALHVHVDIDLCHY